MRIILNQKNRGEEAISILQGMGHEVVYWIGLREEEHVSIPKEVIFHDKRDAQLGKPVLSEGLSFFKPPGRGLIEKMYKTESIMLSMMNRKYSQCGVDERKHIYYGMLSYWAGVLDKYKPEGIIFDDVPHSSYNYVLYELARLKKIPTAVLKKVRIGDRFIVVSDWRKGSDNINKKLEEYRGKHITAQDLEEDVREYYLSQFSRERAPLSASIESAYTDLIKKKKKSKKSVKRKIEHIYAVLLYIVKQKGVLQYISERISTRELPEHEYERIQKRPDYARNYVYVGLHSQPERATSPQGDVYHDQILMIETLSASIPKEWKIYVKEHPRQWKNAVNSSRYNGYYEHIAQLKNVVLVPIETDTFALIDNSSAVATITGTVGIEAVLREKPVLIFGYAWYKDCPYTYFVDSVTLCESVFKKIKEGLQVRQQSVLAFLKSFQDVSVHGYIGVKTVLGVTSQLKKEESMDALLKECISVMEKENQSISAPLDLC